MGTANPPKPSPEPKTPEPEKPKKAEYSILNVTRSVLILTLLLGLLRMLAGMSFAWLLAFVYFTFLLLLIEGLVEPNFSHPWLKWPSLAAVVAGAIWFTISVTCAKAPLDTSAYAMRKGDYRAGTVIGGITWNPRYTDLRILIKNSSDDDYQDVDLTLVPNEMTVDAAILKDPAGGCRLTPIETSTTKIAVNGKIKEEGSSITMTRNRNDGEVHDTEGNIYVTLFRQDGYRLLCSKISPNAVIEIVSAVVGVRNLLARFPPGSIPSTGETVSLGMHLPPTNSISDNYDEKRPFPSIVTIAGGYKNKTKKSFKIGHTIVVDEGN